MKHEQAIEDQIRNGDLTLVSNFSTHSGDVAKFLNEAVAADQEQVAAYFAGELDSFYGSDSKDAMEQAAAKGMTSVFTSAYEGKSKGKGIDGKALLAAVEADHKDTALVIAKNMETFFDSNARDGLESAAEKGWLSIFTVVEGKRGLDGDLTAKAWETAPQDEIDHHKFDRAFSGLKTAIENADAEAFTTFTEEHIEILRTVLASDEGVAYQERLDQMLVSAIKAHTKGLHDHPKESDEYKKFNADMYSITNTVLDMGASAASDDYAAVIAQGGEGGRWSVRNHKLLESLVNDKSDAKIAAMTALFTQLLEDGYRASYIKKFSEKAKVPLTVLGVDVLKDANAEALPVFAEAFEDDPKTLKERIKILNNRLAETVEAEAGQLDAPLATALIEAGADITTRDYRVLKIAARLGHGDLLADMLEGVEDSKVRGRVINEAVVEAAKGEQLEILQILAGENADFAHNNHAAWRAVADAEGGEAVSVREYLESKGAKPPAEAPGTVRTALVGGDTTGPGPAPAMA